MGKTALPRETYVYRDGKLVPKHLAGPTPSKGRGIQVIKDIEPYRAIGIDNSIVSGRKQHRDLLRAHGCIEVGNENIAKLRQPPKEGRDMGLVNEIRRSMGAIGPRNG